MEFVKLECMTFTSLPVMNKVPPSTLEELCVNDDSSILTLEPVRHIVPPFEFEYSPSRGSYPLTPLLLIHVMLYMTPLSPSQYIAPPSSLAILLVNVELYTLHPIPSTYNAAPSLAIQLLKSEL